MTVLVDTSVWVDHFRRPNAVLAELMVLDQVLTHPMVVGELVWPPERTCRDLAGLEMLMDFGFQTPCLQPLPA
jgi:predicted nucleic acid-binding protein